MPLYRLVVTDLAPEMENEIGWGRDVCVWKIIISALTSFSDSGHRTPSLWPCKMKP